MTLPVSSSASARKNLDLETINEVHQTVVRAIRDQVCAWEQEALDAGKRGDFRAAHQFTDWAFAADLCATKASTTCSSLFLDALGSLTVVTDQRTVQLPTLNRSLEDCRLDDLQTEVASAQDAPTF